MLKNKAAKKPDTAKPSINLSASSIITAFITKINKPKVTIVAGSVKKINKGLTIIFNKEITTATIIADVYPATEIQVRYWLKQLLLKPLIKFLKSHSF